MRCSVEHELEAGWFASGASDASGRPFRWPAPGLAFGGDYNPEQWSEEVWREDIELMRDAKVSLVSLGIFSWRSIEPTDGAFCFDQLDRIMGMLDDAGVAVNLATPTAAPP